MPWFSKDCKYPETKGDIRLENEMNFEVLLLTTMQHINDQSSQCSVALMEEQTGIRYI